MRRSRKHSPAVNQTRIWRQGLLYSSFAHLAAMRSLALAVVHCALPLAVVLHDNFGVFLPPDDHADASAAGLN